MRLPRWSTWTSASVSHTAPATGLSWWLAFVIWLVPSNLFLVISRDAAYVSGIQIDYLLPKLYVSQLVVAGLVGLLVWRQRSAWWQSVQRQRRWVAVWLGLSAVLLWHSWSSGYALSSLWAWGSLVLNGLLLAGLSRTRRADWQRPIILAALAATICWQAGLASYQWIFQRALLPYQVSGETNLQAPFGLAERTLASGQEVVLPYGTTAHPNVLAGIMAAYILVWWWLVGWSRGELADQKRAVTVFLTVISLWTIWLTQSWSAGLALGLGGFAIAMAPWLQRRWPQRRTAGPGIGLAWLIVVLLSSGLFWGLSQLTAATGSSWQRRLALNELAHQTIINQPLLGTGLNLFTARVTAPTTGWVEGGRFWQPAHQVGLLWLAETGLVGLVWLVLAGWGMGHLIRPAAPAVWLLAAWSLPLVILDHYLLTLQSGQLLLVVTSYFFLSRKFLK